VVLVRKPLVKRPTMLQQQQGVIVLQNQLARELAAKRSQVNSIAPGFIETEMNRCTIR